MKHSGFLCLEQLCSSMGDGFIQFSAGGTETSLDRKLIRSRAAAHSHRSGERKPKSKSGASRAGSQQPSEPPSRTSSRRGSLAPETKDGVDLNETHDQSAKIANAGLRLNFKLVAHRDGTKRLSGPATPRSEESARLRLEEIDILNSARLGRSRTYPVPEQPFFARFLDFSKLSAKPARNVPWLLLM